MPSPPQHADQPDPREVLRHIPLGRRVVVRSLIEDGQRATDALGELVGRDERSVTVRTRTGEVRVGLAQVVAAKQVPPAPAGAWRLPPFLRRGDVVVLGEGTLTQTDGTASTATTELVGQLVEAGTPVFVLGPAADGAEYSVHGQELGPDASSLVPLGVLATGDRDGFALAHREIEEHLARPVGRGTVHYTDARPAAVDAARGYGWRARVFTPPPGGQGPAPG